MVRAEAKSLKKAPRGGFVVLEVEYRVTVSYRQTVHEEVLPMYDTTVVPMETIESKGG